MTRGPLHRLEFACGAESGPGARSGRVVLGVTGDGVLRVDQPAAGRAWTAVTTPAGVDRLVRALWRAGFPGPPHPSPVPVVAGSVPCALTVEGTPAGRVSLTRPAADRTGYGELLALLDGLVEQVSGGALPAPGADLGVPVADAGPVPGAGDGHRPPG